MSQNKSPLVSVILPVYNDARLDKCLDALVGQSYSEENYEIIVVDNASTIDIKGICLRYPNVTYLYDAVPGSYHARNVGLKVAKGDLLAFTDSDCIPEKNWIESAVQYLNQYTNCDILAGDVKLFFNNPERPTLAELYEQVTAFPQEHYVYDLKFGPTANLWVRREVMEKVGNFNEELKSGGDYEWGRRAGKNGYSMKLSKRVVVRHPARSTFEELKTKSIRVATGHYMLKSSLLQRLLVIARLMMPSLSKISLVMKNKSLDLGQKSLVALLIYSVQLRTLAALLTLHIQSSAMFKKAKWITRSE